MPYNFEATFVQPLLAKLDNGVIKGAEDWAHAITNAYITTIKTGLPQGVPPTLPAPGINPISPPPYPIGASPFTTTSIKGTAMYNVIHAYFLAKEISLEKGAIDSLAVTVKQIILKIKQRYLKVKQLVDEIKLVKEELKQLPKILSQLVSDIKEELKIQVRALTDLIEQTRLSQAELNPEEFKKVFSEELSIIDKLKNFDPKNANDVLSLSVHVTSLSKRDNIINPTKSYVRTKMYGIIGELLNFVNALTNPSKYIDYLSNLASVQTRIKAFVMRVRQFDTFVRYVQPKLRLLEIKKNALVKEIRDVIQPKLVEIQKKLKAKVKELTNKIQNSKAASLYKSAKKSVTDLKKTYSEKIKKVRKKIKLGDKVTRQAIKIGVKADTLYVGILSELENAKTVLVQNVQAVSETYSKQELEKLQAYLNKNDMGSVANICVAILVESKCSFTAFKNYFERSSKVAKLYALEIGSLKTDFDELGNLIKQFNNELTVNSKTKPPSWLGMRIKSFKDLLSYLYKTIQPYVKSIQVQIKKQVDSLKVTVNTKLKKAKKDIEIFALNLIPLKSDVVDKKDKAATAESKRNTLLLKVERGKDLALLYSHYYKAVTGLNGVLGSLATSTATLKPISLSENQNDIDKLVTGYLFLKFRNADRSIEMGQRIDHVITEKRKIMSKFDRLIIVECLVLSIIAMFKDIKNSNFIAELEDFYNELTQVPGKSSLEAFIKLCKNPPTKMSEYENIANQIIMGLMQDRLIVNKLIALEQKYLIKSRAVADSLIDPKKQPTNDVQAALLNIKKELDKKRSFILIGFNLLRKELKEFQYFLSKLIKEVTDTIKKKLDKIKEKIKIQFKKTIDKQVEKRVNPDALLMTVVFGIAARSFWTGARWTGPTGTQHIALNIGVFTRIKAKSTDGASAMIREMARGFNNQLKVMQGLVIPPANTGIPPIPFTGYK
jgi:hypothetical protein